ncbi:19621_t:CDS:2, partial [Funneliformis geosporum]
LNTGAYPKFSHIEDELIKWFTEARGQLKTVTQFMIQIKARSLIKKNHTNQNILMKTTIAQCLPEDYAEKQSEFLSYIMYLRKENQYPISLIGNMNETPMSFNLPTCLANRTKLPPVIIFKLKKILCEEFPEGVIICANSQGWMNEEEMIW